MLFNFHFTISFSTVRGFFSLTIYNKTQLLTTTDQCDYFDLRSMHTSTQQCMHIAYKCKHIIFSRSPFGLVAVVVAVWISPRGNSGLRKVRMWPYWSVLDSFQSIDRSTNRNTIIQCHESLTSKSQAHLCLYVIIMIWH